MNGTSFFSPAHVWLIPGPHMALLVVTEYEKAAVDGTVAFVQHIYTCTLLLIIQPFVTTILN